MQKLLLASTPGPLARDLIYSLFRVHLRLSIAVGAAWSKLTNLTTTTEWLKPLARSSKLGAPNWFVQQVATLGAVAALSCLTLPYAQAQGTAEPSTVTRADLKPLLRADWQGALTYRDYQNQQLVTLATQLSATETTPQVVTLNYVYREPNGKQVRGADQLRLQANGTQIEWDGLLMRVQQKRLLPRRVVQLVLVGEGTDNNQRATVRRTVLLAARQYSVRKEVRFQGDTTFLLRHEYQFQR
ncbi:hypothetical protein [Hymenobacter crusticola]|uniref:Uncharacterized protein n=1 Tax=Hymenobacter crusticola TaxID=1770526 RepID=A0A243WBF8_9BACT|nr:hypothetical protein [Hymenobacter crusticola]OUJ72933.1 hypothetical protein BXP70_16680 [Hymenobacter crusticola]